MRRNIRLVVLAILLLCAAAVSVSAKGSGYAIGGEGSLYVAGNGGLPMSAMITFHIPQVPLMFAVGVSSPFAIGATVDYWAAHGNLSKLFSWYAGIGGYLSVGQDALAVGGRIPVGIQAWPIGSTLEIFAEIAPAVGVVLVPTAFDWHLQAALGLRVRL